MLSYIAASLPQCGNLLGVAPTPVMSDAKVPCIVHGSIVYYTITKLLVTMEDADSYYRLIIDNIDLLFVEDYLLGHVVKKYKLSRDYYRRILQHYMSNKGGLSGPYNAVLKYSMDWYPDIRAEFAQRYPRFIRSKGWCNLFPEVAVQEVTSTRIIRFLNECKYDEVSYLIDFMQDGEMSLQDINIYSCPIKVVSKFLNNYPHIDRYYITAYAIVHNKLPDVKFPLRIDLGVAALCIKYGKEITSELVHTDNINSMIEFAFGIDLTSEVKIMCDKLISLITTNKFDIEYNDDAVAHYIKASLTRKGVNCGMFELDDCDVCHQLRQQCLDVTDY